MGGRILGHRALGLIFVGLLALGVWLVNAAFTQKFATFDEVALKTDTVGLQLPNRADVKVRGVIVGQVLRREAGKGGATLTLGIEPDRIAEIPADVTASILPKTLFGEKYVELVIPEQHATTPLKSGATITQTQLPIEVERVLSDVYPLLRAVQPAELNYTLNAIASALEGRGETIGRSIETLDGYLERINPRVPALIEDLRLLADVSGTYADVMPQIAETLRNTVKTGKTLHSKEGQLNALLKETTSLSTTADTFLNANGNNIVRLGQITQPVSALLRRYSPQIPCFLEGLVDQVPMLDSTYRGFVFHIDAVLLTRQPRGYDVDDIPVFGADNDPNCAGLPNPKVPLTGIPKFNDGIEENLGKGAAWRTATGVDQTTDRGVSAGPAAGSAEKAFFGALAAPVLGVPFEDVPDLSTLLLGPLASGTQVSVR